MTNGSSQGLFVVVAVVVFGIFVAISYSLFRDQLTTSLASMFDYSLDIKKENVFTDILFNLNGHASVPTKDSNNVYSIVVEPDVVVNNWGNKMPVGLRLSKKIEIPYGKKITVKFDLFCTEECTVAIDNNSYSKGEDFNNHPYDSFGTVLKSDNEKNLKGGTWETFTYSYVNNHVTNINKETLLDDTYFGVQYGKAKNFTAEQKILIKNVRYNISDYSE